MKKKAVEVLEQHPDRRWVKVLPDGSRVPLPKRLWPEPTPEEKAERIYEGIPDRTFT